MLNIYAESDYRSVNNFREFLKAPFRIMKVYYSRINSIKWYLVNYSTYVQIKIRFQILLWEAVINCLRTKQFLKSLIYPSWNIWNFLMFWQHRRKVPNHFYWFLIELLTFFKREMVSVSWDLLAIKWLIKIWLHQHYKTIRNL